MAHLKLAATGIWRILLRAEQAVIIAASIMLTLDIFIDVIMRYVLKSPILGIGELAPVFGLWLYFIGAAYAAYERSHVTAGIMHAILRSRPALYQLETAVTGFITFGLTCWATVLSYQLLMWTIAVGQRTMYLRMPGGSDKSAAFVGFVLMAVYFLVHAINDSRGLLKSGGANVGIAEEQR